jgi:hypothetical protein
VVLDLGRHDAVVVEPRPSGGPRRCPWSQVVAFGAAAGEDHLGRAGAEGRRDALAGLLDQPPGVPAGRVQGRRIADLAGGGDVRLQRLGEHRRGRRVIQVGHQEEAYA